MKKDIADMWVEALRSGKYQKVSGTLRGEMADHSFGFCPLGVLCDISKLVQWSSTKGYVIGGISHSGHLPQKVRDWAGVRSPIGKPRNGGQSISHINDCPEMDCTFDQIAGIIEEIWVEL